MYVISGVSGHVGSVAANQLLERKQPVRVIVRDAKKGEAWSKRGAEVAVGSLDDTAFLAGALRGAKGFFTLLPPDMAAADIYAAQRKTADAIAAAVKQSHVPHVVMLSSIGADRATDNGPIKGLHYLENALRATGAKLTAVRAGSFQENVGMVLGAAKNAGIFPSFAPADAPLPQVATRDIGALVVTSLLEPAPRSETVDLVGPAYTARQVAAKLGTALGKDLKVVEVPAAGHVAALVQAGLPQHAAEVMAEMYSGAGRGLLTPKGDRVVQGKTQVDDVIRAMLS